MASDLQVETLSVGAMDSTSDVAATSDGSLRLIGGDLEGHGDVVDANAELTQRALQRYKLLEGSDFQLQVCLRRYREVFKDFFVCDSISWM